jgi:hypothetical protein
MNIFIQIGILLSIIVIGSLIFYYITGDTRMDEIMLLDGTLVGNNTQVINQDPKSSNSKTLNRSNNQKGGIEYTYSWWMFVNEYPSQDGMVFLKGYLKPTTTTFCPKVEISREGADNVMKISFNTFQSSQETVKVTNLPIQKWYHCALTIQNQTVRVYINGKIYSSQRLNGVLRQNYGPLTIAGNGGFPGLVSSLKYYTYSVSPSDILGITTMGPNKTIIGISSDTPPYMANQWFRTLHSRTS